MGKDTNKPDNKLLPACFSSFDTSWQIANWVPDEDIDIANMYNGKII